jgi:hypothetical protein
MGVFSCILDIGLNRLFRSWVAHLPAEPANALQIYNFSFKEQQSKELKSLFTTHKFIK